MKRSLCSKLGRHVWLWPWQQNRRCLLCGRFESLDVGENTIQLSGAGTDVIRWAAAAPATVQGELGMDTATGYPNCAPGGVTTPIIPGVMPAALVTVAANGTVLAMGAGVNTFFTNPAGVAGGVWAADLLHGATPATVGGLRFTNADTVYWSDGVNNVRGLQYQFAGGNRYYDIGENNANLGMVRYYSAVGHEMYLAAAANLTIGAAGVWTTDLGHGATPATTGAHRFTNGDSLYWNNGTGTNVRILTYTDAGGGNRYLDVGQNIANIEAIRCTSTTSFSVYLGAALYFRTTTTGIEVGLATGPSITYAVDGANSHAFTLGADTYLGLASGQITIGFDDGPSIIHNCDTGMTHEFYVNGTKKFSIEENYVTVDVGALRLSATNPASAGALRMANLTYIKSRNAANTGDLEAYYATGGDVLWFGATGGAVRIGGAGGALYCRGNGVDSLICSSSRVDVGVVTIRWGATIVSPVIDQADETGAGVTGDTMTFRAQNSTGAGTTGGTLALQSGTGTSAGGNVELRNSAGTARVQASTNGCTLSASLYETGIANVAATPYNVAATDRILKIRSATGGGLAITVNLPAVATSTGRRLTIKDCDGSCGANNCTIDGNLAELIDGSLTNVISTNFGAREIVCDGSGWYVAAHN